MSAPTISPADFMAAAPPPLNGSSPWASRYAGELRRIATEHARRAPRSLQRHLGPSELGSPCDRQVVGKMAGGTTTNHVSDPWPSIVGTAVHAWLADAFTAENTRRGIARFLAEQRVTPLDGHPGTADLYDAAERAVVDHKVLGPTSMGHVRSDHGPRRGYRVQLHLYGLGYRRMGLPVERIALAAWPRTRSTMDDLYVWDELVTPATDALLAEVAQQTAHRTAVAAEVAAGRYRLRDVPATPDDTECFFCPFYRPESARDGGPGCPGTVGAP